MMSAKTHWITLRVLAFILIPYSLWLVYSIVSLAGASHADFIAWLQQPVNAVLLMIFIVASFWHAALGSHEIIEDYVHAEPMKTISLKLKTLAFLIVGCACLYAVCKIAFL